MKLKVVKKPSKKDLERPFQLINKQINLILMAKDYLKNNLKNTKNKGSLFSAFYKDKTGEYGDYNLTSG